MGHDFGAGTGDAFKVMNGGGDGSGNRRKRSTLNANTVLKSIFRAKRQAESSGELAAAVEPNEQSTFQRMKQQFNRIMDAVQEIFKKFEQIGQSDIAY